MLGAAHLNRAFEQVDDLPVEAAVIFLGPLNQSRMQFRRQTKD